jgi:hypothetical protein
MVCRASSAWPGSSRCSDRVAAQTDVPNGRNRWRRRGAAATGADGKTAAASIYPQGVSRFVGAGRGRDWRADPDPAASYCRLRVTVLGPYRGQRACGNSRARSYRGNQTFAQRVSSLSTFFVDRAAAESVTTPDDSRLKLVGQLVVDASGNGTITFVIPSLPPGPYAVTLYCPSCSQYSAGRVMLPVADFTITPSPPDTSTAGPDLSLLRRLSA